MRETLALPFIIKRSDNVLRGDGMTTRRETIHGLLRLQGEELTIQWRVGTKTQHLDSDAIRTEQEVEPVREITVPLQGIAGAVVRRRWYSPFAPRLVLTAADLSAFEGLAGKDGLSLHHPAEVVLRIRHSDRLAAEEFGAELVLAIAAGAPTAHALESDPDRARRTLP